MRLRILPSTKGDELLMFYLFCRFYLYLSRILIYNLLFLNSLDPFPTISDP
jgi:hypothetical protein